MTEQRQTGTSDAFADLLRGETSAELAARAWSYTRWLDEAIDEPTRALLACWLDATRREIRLRERMSDPLRSLHREAARFDLARIKEEIAVDEAVRRLAGVELARRGGNYVGRCPFPDHHDGSPSFHVRADGRLWHCRGCGRGGDLFSFAEQWYDTRSFVAAVEIVVTGMGQSLASYRIEAPRRGEGAHVRVA